MLRRRFLTSLAFASPALRALDEDRVWRDYIEWYRKQPASVTDLGDAYRAWLRHAGVAESEIESRVRIVERLSRERREELHPAFFDRTYSSAEPRFNAEPNALLVETIRGMKPGRALDIDMGQGRNALFLARQGWDVTGFDFSGEGVRAAREAAAKARVKLTALQQRNEDFDFGDAQWDLVLMSYTWVPLQEPYLTRIMNSLKPGGLLVFEGLMDESGSERAAPWLPRPGQFPQVFSRLEALRYEDTRAKADWAWRPERIARFVGRRPLQ